MALSDEQKGAIRKLLSDTIASKLKNYEPETTSMPFLERLIQDGEKIAAYSFIHSTATSLGQSIFENVSVIVAKPHVEEAQSGYKLGVGISKAQKTCINNIVRNLRNGNRKANIKEEIDEVLAANSANRNPQKDGETVDFYMRKGSQEYLFEIKTAKPNIDIFNKSKTKLLEWVARRGPGVRVYLAIPYNPYDPAPYNRFAETGMMDHPNDFLIGKEYWDFLGEEGAFEEILEIFDEIGKQYKPDMDAKFAEIAARQGGTHSRRMKWLIKIRDCLFGK